jgi:hypothetical protein
MRMTRLGICLLSIASVFLSACGSEDATPQVAQQPAKSVDTAPKPVASAKASADPTEKMAHAVGNGKPRAAVDIRYEFQSKPEVGKPTQIEVDFIPNAGTDALTATFTGMDGITVAGHLAAHFDKLEQGKPYKHTISLLPEAAGVYYVTVSVETEISGASLSRTFSIPFVVGDVQALQKPKAPPQKDASGQAIQPMKAKESGG